MKDSLYDHQTHTLKGPYGKRTLTPHAHRLMQCLLASPDGILFNQIIDAVWPGNTKPATAANSLRIHILRLQQKLAETGARVTLDNVQCGTGLYALRKKPRNVHQASETIPRGDLQ